MHAPTNLNQAKRTLATTTMTATTATISEVPVNIAVSTVVISADVKLTPHIRQSLIVPHYG